jgi:hypothetical protein
MKNDTTTESTRPSFDAIEEEWFAETRPSRRPSRLPSYRPMSYAPPADDSIDGWFGEAETP